MAAVVVSDCSPSLRQTYISLQAQFVLSPDPLFSESGTTSKINYSDRFKQYKKFIVKHLETPRMKILMAGLDAELFQPKPTDIRPSASPAETQEADEEEDEFSHAFSNEIVQGMLVFACTLHYP